MAYIYRYIDLADDIIKYVGIVWSNNRTLSQRIREHEVYDDWCKKRRWKIQYIEENITTRTDAEYFESHYISLYNTDKFFNIKKSGWGISSYLLDRESDWKDYEYSFDLSNIMNKIDDAKNQYEELLIEINKLNKEYNTLSLQLEDLKENAKSFGQQKQDLVKQINTNINDNIYELFKDKDAIGKELIGIIDLYIYDTYIQNKELALKILEIRNKIIFKFIHRNYWWYEKLVLYEEDIIKYNNERFKNKHKSTPIRMVCYYNISISNKTYDIYSQDFYSMKAMEQETGIPQRFISDALHRNRMIMHHIDAPNSYAYSVEPKTKIFFEFIKESCIYFDRIYTVERLS